MRGATIDVSVNLITETCCNQQCGILFAVPETWNREQRRTHKTWYCPNGHPQSYTAKSREEELRDQLAETKRSLEYQRERSNRLEDRNTNLRNSNRALRGVATKLRKRIAEGVCPFCDHRFDDVASHVVTEHPKELTDAQADAEAHDAGVKTSSTNDGAPPLRGIPAP